jgi:UDP-glucuronate 4-epimerase
MSMRGRARSAGAQITQRRNHGMPGRPQREYLSAQHEGNPINPLPLAGLRVLVTGAAGFIGMHVAESLCAAGAFVTGIDNFDPYYDVELKKARVARLEPLPGFRFERLDLADARATAQRFEDGGFRGVVHLAAQPGVRYSLVNPEAYITNNLVVFGHVLEGCRHGRIGHLVYASSSSVYGANHVLPFSEDQNVDHPVSLYAATKKANELMAHSYSHLFGLPATGLRFFTVYGPWGRPDMSPMLFAKAILAGEPITVFNHGKMRRDFTYVDDIVEGVIRILARPPSAAEGPPHAIYNIGNHTAVELETFIATLETLLGRASIKHYAPMQAGDVPATYAAIDRIAAATGFVPHTQLADGLARFVAWYRSYHGLPAA